MLILASQSPRRRRLLAAVGVRFDIRPVDLDESARSGEAPMDYVRRLAIEKAQKAFENASLAHGDGVLGADTVVVLDGDIIGKPADPDHARTMLGRLSGRTHTVFTGVCVLDHAGVEHASVMATTVRFRNLGAREIEAYVASGEAADKAGSYAIQGTGGALVDRVEGSYTNVIGLPLAETLRLLEAAGVNW